MTVRLPISGILERDMCLCVKLMPHPTLAPYICLLHVMSLRSHKTISSLQIPAYVQLNQSTSCPPVTGQTPLKTPVVLYHRTEESRPPFRPIPKPFRSQPMIRRVRWLPAHHAPLERTLRCRQISHRSLRLHGNTWTSLLQITRRRKIWPL